MSNFALVSILENEEFPSHCVMLFSTEREAVLYAVGCIVRHDDSVEYNKEESTWTFEDEHFDSPGDLLNAWQEGLDTTEYFHIKPVQKTIFSPTDV